MFIDSVCGRTDSVSLTLTAHLPLFDRTIGPNKHQDLEQQAVTYNDAEDYFDHQKHNYGSPKSESTRYQESYKRTQQIAKRVNDRIAFIAQRRSFSPIAIYYKRRVLENFPGSLTYYCQQDLPLGRHSSEHETDNPEQKESVKDMCEAKGIEKLL